MISPSRDERTDLIFEISLKCDSLSFGEIRKDNEITHNFTMPAEYGIITLSPLTLMSFAPFNVCGIKTGDTLKLLKRN